MSEELPALKLRGLQKSFIGAAGKVHVLDGIELTVQPGEFVSVIGPSGCGKTTLLNVVAGVEEPDAGELHIAGIETEERLGQVALMPQEGSLLPWRRALDNAAVGLEGAGMSRREARAAALRQWETFGLRGFERAWPGELSSGMQQRVGLLRTFLPERSLYLLDEPFGKLDAIRRAAMQQWLLEHGEVERKTVLFVTHDVEEAIFLSDRVLVMSPRPGRLMHAREIELPRPRLHEATVTSGAFMAIRAELLAALRGGLS